MDPKTLPEYVRTLYGILILAASTLSFIPTEANFGGALASVMIHDLLEPFRRRVYDGTADLLLRKFFPTRDLSPFIVARAADVGALTFEDLTDEAARSGLRPEGTVLLEKYARVQRFNTATKDDFALVRTYHQEIIRATIEIVKDQEKAVIAELTSRRKDLVAQLNSIGGP